MTTHTIDIGDGYLVWARTLSRDLRNLAMSDFDGLRDLVLAGMEAPTQVSNSVSIAAVYQGRVVAVYQATATPRRGGPVWKLRPDLPVTPAVGAVSSAKADPRLSRGQRSSRKAWRRLVGELAINHVRAADQSPRIIRPNGDAAGFLAAAKSWRRSVDTRSVVIFGIAAGLFMLPGMVDVFTPGRRGAPELDESDPTLVNTLENMGRLLHRAFLEAPILQTISAAEIPAFIVGVVGVVAALAIALAVRPRTAGLDAPALVQQLRWTAWAGWTIAGVAALGLALAGHLLIAKPGELLSWACLLLAVGGAVAASVSAEGALDLALTNAHLIAARRQVLIDKRNRIVAGLGEQPTRRQIVLGVASHVGIASAPLAIWAALSLLANKTDPEPWLFAIVPIVAVVYAGSFFLAYLINLAVWNSVGARRSREARDFRLVGSLALVCYLLAWLSLPGAWNVGPLTLFAPASLLPGLGFTRLRGVLNPGVGAAWRVVKGLQKRIERQFDRAAALNRPDASVF